MNTQNLKKILFPLALLAFSTTSIIRAEDAAPAGTEVSTPTVDAEEENTLPLTLEDFDTLRGLIQRQADNAAQLQNDFQAFLDKILGIPASDATTPAS